MLLSIVEFSERTRAVTIIPQAYCVVVDKVERFQSFSNYILQGETNFHPLHILVGTKMTFRLREVIPLILVNCMFLLQYERTAVAEYCNYESTIARAVMNTGV